MAFTLVDPRGNTSANAWGYPHPAFRNSPVPRGGPVTSVDAMQTIARRPHRTRTPVMEPAPPPSSRTRTVTEASGTNPAAEVPVDTRRGTVALVLSLVAVVSSTTISLVTGAAVGPMEAAYGRSLLATPEWFTVSVLAGAGSQILWTALGVAGLITGIAAAVSDHGRIRGTTAAVIAAAAPLVSFATFVAAMLITAPVA